MLSGTGFQSCLLHLSPTQFYKNMCTHSHINIHFSGVAYGDLFLKDILQLVMMIVIWVKLLVIVTFFVFLFWIFKNCFTYIDTCMYFIFYFDVVLLRCGGQLSSLPFAPIVSCSGSLLCISHIDFDVSSCCCQVFCFSVSVQGCAPSLIWLPVRVCAGACVRVFVCVCVRARVTPLAVGLSSFCPILVTCLPFIFSIRWDKPALCLGGLWQFVFTILFVSVHEHSIKAGTKKLSHKNSLIIPFSSFNARNPWILLNLCLPHGEFVTQKGHVKEWKKTPFFLF